MSVGFALVCLVAAAVPLGILYMLYGPTAPRPVVAVPRASLLGMRAQTAPVVAPARTYQPEAVYAVEHANAIADISQRMSIPSKRSIATPPPPPPRRMARSSEPPPRPRPPERDDTARNPVVPNPFADEGATHWG